MRAVPGDVLLSWPIPNPENPVTRGDALIIVNSIFVSLVTIVVALRLYTRLWVKRWFGSDDAFIILAYICTVALTAVVLMANKDFGWDRHIYDIPFAKITPTAKIALAAKAIFTSAATFTRLSLLCFYYRLVQDSGKKWFVWTIHANVAFSVAIFITFICLAIFQCNPIRNYWIYGAPPETCLDEGSVTIVAGVINCVADLICTILPIPMVMQLQMPRRQRVAVTILFSMGFIVTIAGIVRTWYIYKSLIAEYDLTWYAFPLWIAAAIEIDLGVICASAPVLRPLLARLSFTLSSFGSKVSTKQHSTGEGFPSTQSKNRTVSGTTLRGEPSQSSHYKSVLSSKRRTEPIEEEAEAAYEKGQQFELRQWDDVERGLRASSASLGDSQDAILGSEDGGDTDWADHRKSWQQKKVTITELESRGIKPTSEEEVQLDRASTVSTDIAGPLPRTSFRMANKGR